METEGPEDNDIEQSLAEEAEEKDMSEEIAGEGVNLSSLKELEMGPDWTAPGYKAGRSFEGKGGFEKRLSPSSKGAPRRERGEWKRAREKGKDRDRRDRRSTRVEERRYPLIDELEISFNPEEKAFRALTSAIRANCRTYELFEIARLILDKPERFVVLVRLLKKAEPEERGFFISVPDGLPFESEAEVTDYVLRNFLEDFCEVESIEVEPPTGEFPMVNRCSLTREIIGPPNYHRYQELERAHITDRLSHLSLEAARSKIESVKDPETIENWVRKMTQQTRYKMKVPVDGETVAPVFESFESARHHVLTHQKQRVFRISVAAKFEGRGLEKLPEGSNLRQCVALALEEQRRFPLVTANRLRGRLKRIKFDVYKRGSRGISYTCAVNRKIRSSDDTFAKPVQELIEFIQDHPQIRATDLPREMQESKGATDAEAGAKEEEGARGFGQIKQDLHWLVADGYVVEYSDGRLAAAPRRPAPRESSQSTDKEAGEASLTGEEAETEETKGKKEDLSEGEEVEEPID